MLWTLNFNLGENVLAFFGLAIVLATFFQKRQYFSYFWLHCSKPFM